jgi:hypothetical protein
VDIITVDGMTEQDFRHSVEDMLRSDQIDEAVERLRGLLDSCAGVSEVLPSRFLEVSSSDLEFVGWHRLAHRLLDHDKPGRPVSAIGVTLADARALGGPGPSGGKLHPFIKTFYFSDAAFPFSDATRDDLLDGYSREGFEWQGDYQATDATLSINGIDDLYGAIVELEDRLFDCAQPDENEIRAGAIGSCYLAALMHQSLRDTIRRKGLPRPLCVLAACDGVYPFFDAPVAGSDECTAQEQPEATLAEPLTDEPDGGLDDEADEVDEPLLAEASLLDLFSRRAAKAPVLVLCEADAREAAENSEMAEAQSLAKGDEGTLKELLKVAHLAHSAELPELGDDAAWPDPDWPDRHFETAGSSAVSAELVRAVFPDRQGSSDAADTVEPDGVGDGAFATSAAEWDSPIPSDDLIADDPDATETPFIAPQSHKLRAQIRLSEPVTAPGRGRVGAAIDWLRRVVLRR